MGYDTASKTDPESVIDDEWGGMWFLTDELDNDHVGISILEPEEARQVFNRGDERAKLVLVGAPLSVRDDGIGPVSRLTPTRFLRRDSSPAE